MLNNLDPTIIAVAIVMAIMCLVKLNEDKEMKNNTDQKTIVRDKYYYWDLWDKICFWFWLPIAIAFFTAPTIASFAFSGNYHDGIFLQVAWVAILVALFRAA